MAIDGFGIYFADASLDTVSYCKVPLTFFSPQVQNLSGNIIKDTLNWTAVTGTFIATGNEKYAVLGNFKSNPLTNTVLANPTDLPQLGTDVYFDDVSLIELNLPAFAGRDTSVAPGNNVFIGRQPDVGIDEACVWYKLPSALPIDTVAGMWVNPATTSTYVVVQTICGWVKSDTVIVHVNLQGVKEPGTRASGWLLWPNPADDKLLADFTQTRDETMDCKIYDNLGQLIREEDLKLKDNKATIIISDLPNGVYFISLKNANSEIVSKKFVVNR